MNNENDNFRTLQSYQDKTQEYVEGTPPIDDTIKDWLNESLVLIPKDGKILEVGSGFGRDAEYIRNKGFDIECSDAVPNFVELLQNKGFKTRTLDLLNDELAGGYDMVLADAVLLHFTREESESVTRKIHAALRPDGIFALRMKQGDGPVWTEEKLGEPRYFYYWQPEDLKQMLEDCGFEWLNMTESFTGHNKASWMHIILKKH
jgi:SAM-dependent methyltransferase